LRYHPIITPAMGEKCWCTLPEAKGARATWLAARGCLSVRSILMDDLFVVAPDLIYRREHFGSLVFSGRTKETRFFNHAAAAALEGFMSGAPCDVVATSIADVGVSTEAARGFVNVLVSAGLVVPAASVPPDRAARFFFTDVEDFAEGRLHAPLGAELELTLRCMRRCAYCAYESHPSIATSADLTRADWARVIVDLANAGVSYVRFTGGDPLTRPDALDIIADADQMNFALTIASDLTVLSHEMVERLAALKNLVAVQTTLDGAAPGDGRSPTWPWQLPPYSAGDRDATSSRNPGHSRDSGNEIEFGRDQCDRSPAHPFRGELLHLPP
jgi:hypothetical protein